VKHLVQVWGNPIEVDVVQLSASVWVATGLYKEQHMEAKGMTENAALRAWCDAARYAGK
jgi:hypothetical protein